MTEIEKYAVKSVADGARSYIEDDIDEEEVFDSEADWRAAVKSGLAMAKAIEDNQDSFLAWFRSTTA